MFPLHNIAEMLHEDDTFQGSHMTQDIISENPDVDWKIVVQQAQVYNFALFAPVLLIVSV